MITDELVRIDYTNHRGERKIRTIRPRSMWFGESSYHPGEKQWFIDATEPGVEDGNRIRSFAKKYIHSWEPAR